MSGQIDKLKTLLRLRRRDVDRRAREAALAAAAVAAAEAARNEAQSAAAAAWAQRERAFADRLGAPADAHVAEYCGSCEQRVREATDAIGHAERAITEATDRAAAIRQHLRRAELRLEALSARLREVVVKHRRSVERRLADGHAVAGDMAWA